jgi:hypothetical protein
MMHFRKKLLIIATLCFLATLIAGGLFAWHVLSREPGAFTEQELAAFAERAHGPTSIPDTAPDVIEPGRRVRLAIGSLGLPAQENIADLVLTELSDAKGLEMIERQALERVLSELQMSAAGLVRASDAVRVGKLLRADWFLLGTPAAVNGTNVAVVRVVDARTGVMRDATMIPNGLDGQASASNLTTFVRQARQDAANPRPKTYLAIGGFEDLGLNSRQARLPGELRSYLTAAYQGSEVTMFEREFVNVLLREMYLDLAGLTEGSATNVIKPMQAAYWIVDGFYQSYETTNLQVELVLDVRRMFGRNRQVQLREKAGEPFFQSVKSSIDHVMERDKAAPLFSRTTEVKAQMQKGNELARIIGDHAWVRYEGYSSLPENEMARHRRNAREAIRCFETVLLLDPTNREARVCLATCLRKTFNDRFDDARQYYRQVIDAPAEDRWSRIARNALVQSFGWPNASESKLQWFETAAQGTTNPAAIAFYKAQIKEASQEAIIRRGGTQEAEHLAEARLFEELKSFDTLIHTGSGMSSGSMGMDDFGSVIGENKERVALRLAELYPKMSAAFPDLAPYILASIITFQVDTNASIFAEFERTLDWCAQNSSKIPQKGTTFWSHLHSTVYYWASEHKYHDLALKILETTYRAAAFDPRAESMFDDSSDLMELAFNYMDCKRWSNALTLFEAHTNRPIKMDSSGSWGAAFSVVLPNKEAARCREKLGLPNVKDPREFELGKPCLCLHDPKHYRPWSGENPVIAAESDGLWIAIAGKMMRIDSALQTNVLITLPGDSMSPFTAIQIDDSKIWLGTAESGIFEFDKVRRSAQQITEEDGLLLNSISSLCRIGDTLWIGYGSGARGGLGKMDLKTRKCTAFPISLRNDSISECPPQSPVTEIRPGKDNDLWLVAGSTLRRYRIDQDLWESAPKRRGVSFVCYEMDEENLIQAHRVSLSKVTIETTVRSGLTNTTSKSYLLLSDDEQNQLRATLKTNANGRRIWGSQFGGTPSRGALALQSIRDSTSAPLLLEEALPSPPTTLTRAGRDLWVGGQGYVALVDLDENKIKKLAYLSARSVDRIQVAGGYLWVQCDKHLYRARL